MNLRLIFVNHDGKPQELDVSVCFGSIFVRETF
jgi:hypothetical protein